MLCCCNAAIVKPKAGPKGKVYTEEDWNAEADENAQDADAYRYSKVCTPMSSVIAKLQAVSFGALRLLLCTHQCRSDYAKSVIQHQTFACMSSTVTCKRSV